MKGFIYLIDLFIDKNYEAFLKPVAQQIFGNKMG